MDLVFWPAAVRTHSFADHVRAAVAGGFTALAIAPETYALERAAGRSARDLSRLAADHDVPIRHLDTVTAWAPLRAPDWASPEVRARFDVSLDDCFAMAEALGLETMLAIAGFEAGALAQSALVDCFGAFCERAGRSDLWVDLEFMPFLGIPNLASAWAIVSGAKAANSGILIDTWHFARGDYDLDLLAANPGDHPFSLQLADGWATPRAASLFEDTLRFRRFPGEGELPLADILSALIGKGRLRSVGVEIYSDEADALAAEEAGRRCGAGMRDIFARAGLSVGPYPLIHSNQQT